MSTAIDTPLAGPVTGEVTSRRPAVPSATGRTDEGTWSLVWRVALGSRVIVWVAALLAIMWFGENVSAATGLDPTTATAPFQSVPLDKLLAPAARWDSSWYLNIAAHGYFSRQSSSFFPLYPLLIRLGSLTGTPAVIAGMMISLGCMLGGLAVLHRLAGLDLDGSAARLTVTLVAFFPTSLFLTADYTESLFLLLTVGAVYAARRDRWMVACLCGALASATRSNGVLILVPLVVLYFYGPRTVAAIWSTRSWRPLRGISRSTAWLLLVPAGLVAYVGYLWIAHDAPLAPFASESYWGHWFAGPFGAVGVALLHLPHDLAMTLTGRGRRIGPGDPLGWSNYDLIDLGYVIVAAVGVAAAWRRVPLAYIAYAVVMLAEVLSEPTTKEPLTSFARYLLPVFPVFMGLAGMISPRRKTTIVVLVIFSALLAVFSGLWGIWDWVA